MGRLIDFVLAVAGLVVLSPLFVVLAIAIAIADGPPVLYTQVRVGKGFVDFGMYKFRTMRVQSGGRPITSDDDPRITPLGRFLRKYKLDELPQLLNVAKGDMAFVGPRPEIPRYVELFRDDFATILTVRPGISGAASVKFNDESEILAASDDPERLYVEQILPEKIAIEKQYLADRSMATDFKILAATISVLGR